MSSSRPSMSTFQRRLYRMIVCLHPATFRNKFGREMSLDFEDALAGTGFVSLLLDASLCLGRQWAGHLVSGGADRGTGTRPSLLAGQYVMVREEALSPLELTRGLIVSVTLLGLCAFGLRLGPGTARAGLGHVRHGSGGGPSLAVGNGGSVPKTATQPETQCYVLMRSRDGLRNMKAVPANAKPEANWRDLNHVQYKAMPISVLVPFLSSMMHCPVADETGLTGKYDFSLAFSRNTSPAQIFDGTFASSAHDSLPSISTALETQLGLKLQPN